MTVDVRRLGWLAICVATGLVYVVMLAPILIVVLQAFSAEESLRFPPRGVSLRWFGAFWQSADFLRSFRISVELAAAASLLSGIIGTLAAYGLWRERSRRAAIETLLLSPLYVPRVLIGMALLLGFSKLGLVGSLSGLLLAHVVVTAPFVMRAVAASLVGIPPELEEAARSLGASRSTVFWKVTVPLVSSGVASGMVFAFVTSFSDVYLSLFIAGPETITLPLRVFNYMEWEQTPLVAAVSAVQLAFIVVVLVVSERIFGLSKTGRA